MLSFEQLSVAAQVEALGTVFSGDVGAANHDMVVDALERDDMQALDLLGVYPWEPFEEYSASRLLEVLDGFAEQFVRFGELVIGGVR